MATNSPSLPLRIDDLTDSRELDQAAMRSITGGSARDLLFRQRSDALLSSPGTEGRSAARGPFAWLIEQATRDR